MNDTTATHESGPAVIEPRPAYVAVNGESTVPTDAIVTATS